MRKTTLRTASVAVTLAGGLLLPAAAASAATGVTPPDRDNLSITSVNGGDNGFGNCGVNASGGRKGTLTTQPFDGAVANGYGGFRRGDDCDRERRHNDGANGAGGGATLA